MSLQEKLGEAKEKAALQTFEVTITETLQKTVTVQAKNLEDAIDAVEYGWKDGDYVLDADDFAGVSVDAAPKMQERTHCEERRKGANLA